MAIARYLAMTAEEFASAQALPGRVAWMACHFSPYSASLSNLPEKLPANSLLILNDSTPPSHQNPEFVAKTLETIQKEWDCCAILLDFQRPGCQETRKITEELVTLDFPVCVSECYARDLECPVFLPPLPLTVPLFDYIRPWKGREIWLDAALSCEQITVTDQGSSVKPTEFIQCPFSDQELHCHYRIEKKDDSFIFTLQRTKDDLNDLLAEADNMGITAAVGLYQELK